MIINNENDALHHWQQKTDGTVPAMCCKWSLPDDAFVVFDARRNVIGMVTPEGHFRQHRQHRQLSLAGSGHTLHKGNKYTDTN